MAKMSLEVLELKKELEKSETHLVGLLDSFKAMEAMPNIKELDTCIPNEDCYRENLKGFMEYITPTLDFYKKKIAKAKYNVRNLK